MDEISKLMKNSEESEEKLNEVTIKIVDYKRNMVQNAWNIGAELNKVKEQKLFLWKYATFEDYLIKDVCFGRASAYSFMKVAEEMDVQSFIQYNSTEKCKLLVSLDKEERDVFVKQYSEVISEMPVREMKKNIERFKRSQDKTEEDFEIKENKDWNYFLECLELGEEIIKDKNRLKIKIEKFDDYLDGIDLRKDSFNEYKYKKNICEIKEQIEKLGI